ncbi:hypothetical protein QE152_g26313 [Popillia japonica]|uniref:DDE Tnp4 domain-containing protein n=1 Tax=Popillia japonica TaxID=7064 RepID=A0AAW1JZY8_POPJA
MISRIIFEITTIVANGLLPNWVKFPINAEEKNIIKQGFYEKWNIRGVIGVIDGTHVEIITPPANDVNHPPYVYINRKGRHSINVLLVDFDVYRDIKYYCITPRGKYNIRFRCLSRHQVLLYHPIRAANIIYTCCVLHNIALRANIILPENDVEYREIDREIDVQHYNDVLQVGRTVRNTYLLRNFVN